ncbi:MAG: acyltransferase [Candidatus Stahlbacteria bacterium]|nr:acyltransferase [Candidatus Stahlbacteria bacterium]
MNTLKNFVKKIPFIKFLLSVRSNSVFWANFIFQHILRINSNCKYSVHYTSCVVFPEKLLLWGNNPQKSLALSPCCYLLSYNGIEINEGTLFGPGVKIISANHKKNNLSELEKNRPIKIGKNCWLGANVIILPGVELGDNTIVGAGAVVTKSYPQGNITLIGIPAHPAKF